MIWPWTKTVAMTPPKDKVAICPLCSGSVDGLLLVKKSRKTGPMHAHVSPCGDVLHTEEEMLAVIGGG